MERFSYLHILPSSQSPFLQTPLAPHGVPSIIPPLKTRHPDPEALLHDREQELLVGQDLVTFKVNPRCWHWASREVHCPEAHFKLVPQSVPSNTKTSEGQEPEDPVQYSGMSHEVDAGRHWWVLDWYWHWLQHESFTSLFPHKTKISTSPTFFIFTTFQLTRKQHYWWICMLLDHSKSWIGFQGHILHLVPRSHCHTFVRFRLFFYPDLNIKQKRSAILLHAFFLPCKQVPMDGKVLQIVETEQGLNSWAETLLVGFMMYVPPASQTEALRGQQLHCDPLHWQLSALQSWFAPRKKSAWVTLHS